jgi:hypothetical protein
VTKIHLTKFAQSKIWLAKILVEALVAELELVKEYWHAKMTHDKGPVWFVPKIALPKF